LAALAIEGAEMEIEMKHNRNVVVAIFATMWLCMYLSFVGCVASVRSAVVTTNTSRIATSKVPDPTDTLVPLPTNTATPAPTETLAVVDECGMKITFTSGDLTAIVYMIVRGDDALAYCALMTEYDKPGVTVDTVDDYPIVPVACTKDFDTVTVSIVDPSELWGKYTCQGFLSE
jgi:hypothetical protein